MDWKAHKYHVGSHVFSTDTLPSDLDGLVAGARKHIEPWLSAVFQSEHLNLLLGSGFAAAVSAVGRTAATGMAATPFGTEFDGAIDDHAAASAARMGRSPANMEDQFRSALALLDGLTVLKSDKVAALRSALELRLSDFLRSLLATERGILDGADSEARAAAAHALQSFLLSFAGRAGSRERLHIFTTNYDRLIEHGADLAGLRIIDRFVGALNPRFRSSRAEVDIHYNPPGIRGEPRFMEGVVRLTKLHGSLDWVFDGAERQIHRKAIPFGAPSNHTDVPTKPLDTTMIYPNPAKDVETTQYPYAELFRDFAAAVCRPNAALITFGYGFGDDHVNRILLDMLTIPSTHVVIISYDVSERLKAFCARTRSAQLSLLVGRHFSDLQTLIENYLPKPALDFLTGRMTEMLKRRGRDTDALAGQASEGTQEPTSDRESF